MTKPRLVLALLLLVGAVAAAIYFWRQSSVHESAPPLTPKAEAPSPAAAAPEPPAIRHPIEKAAEAVQTPAPAAPLPTLANSDAVIGDALATVVGTDVFRQLINTDALVHRFVVTIDNLPRAKLPAQLLPVKPVAGTFVASVSTNGMTIGADNAQRYARYVAVLEAMDTKRLVALYVHFYPLLQQMYQTLGYPQAYFNDRVVDAIDDMLAAPEPEGPIPLTQPKVLYQFADPGLEALSSGQKTMVRMGLDNERRIKAKLRDIRRTLTQVVPPN